MIFIGICMIAFLGIAGYIVYRVATSTPVPIWFCIIGFVFSGFLGGCSILLSERMRYPWFIGISMLEALAVVSYLAYDAATTTRNKTRFRIIEFVFAAFFVIVVMALTKQLR